MHLLKFLLGHAKASTVVRKSNIKTYTPSEQVKVEPNIAIVKDLLSDNIDGHVIYFYDETARIAKPRDKDKPRPVVGVGSKVCLEGGD